MKEESREECNVSCLFLQYQSIITAYQQGLSWVFYPMLSVFLQRPSVSLEKITCKWGQILFESGAPGYISLYSAFKHLLNNISLFLLIHLYGSHLFYSCPLQRQQSCFSAEEVVPLWNFVYFFVLWTHLSGEFKKS